MSSRALIVLALCALVAACRTESERAPEPRAPASAAAPGPPVLAVLAVPSIEAAVRAAGEVFRERNPGIKLEVELAPPVQIRARLGGEPNADVVVIEGELAEGRGVVPGSARRIGESKLLLVRSRRGEAITQPAELLTAFFPHFVFPDPAHNPSGAAVKAWLAETRQGDRTLLEALGPRLLAKPDARATAAELERRGRTMGVILEVDLSPQSTIQPVFELPGRSIAFTAAAVPGPDREHAARFIGLLVERGLSVPAGKKP